MSELKTMKDIEIPTYVDKHCNVQTKKSIKAEAIKWVKEHRSKSWNWTEDTWLDFFNITGDDLK